MRQKVAVPSSSAWIEQDTALTSLLVRYPLLPLLLRYGTEQHLLVIRGITAKQAAQISSLLSLIRLSHQPQDLHLVIRTPEDIWTLVKHLQFEDREHFQVLVLSTKDQVILKETVSIGSLSSSIVPPREYHKPLVSHS